MKINILDQSVYNRIAAGEVVENPASVVKELVENSIDAGATQIGIYIWQGGIKSIEITDNGCGIEKEELYKTILPHATSKIATAFDLDSIATLGFRGEAIASIASVSEIEIKSKFMQSEIGAKLNAKGGENAIIADTAYNQGTSIMINNLFYNTPARFKFLKGVKTEEAYVTKAVSQLILANSSIAFKYYADGKKIYDSDGSGIISAVEAIYSKDIYSKLIPIIENGANDIQIRGLISEPSLYKNNRNLQTIILNGRVITDANVSATVNNAYGGRLMNHNFPVFVLDILMRFDDVDVNVHPNKREVRFANPRQVYGAIYNAIKYTLETYEAAACAQLNTTEKVLEPISAAQQTEQNAEISHTETKPLSNTYTKTNQIKSFDTNNLLSVAYYLDKLENKENSNIVKVAENTSFSQFSDIFLPKDTIGDVNKPKIEEVKVVKNYKVIGQIFDTYIAIEYDNEFFIIDQHAAHERLLYDKLMAATDKDETASQPLLIPYIYEDSPVKIAEILSLSVEINKLGFEIEEFGNNTIKINAVPQPLTDIDHGKFLAEISEGIKYREFSQSDVVKEKLIQKACKSAIKGGYSYNKEQTDKIVKYFFDNGMPIQCPHGRPTYIKFTISEIEKLFRRKI